MYLFRPAPPRPAPDATYLARLKAAARRHFALDDAVVVSVTQLASLKPGCPPIETAIGILSAESRLHKIHKPIADVTNADVASLGAPQ